MATPIPPNRAIVSIEEAASATGGTVVRAGSVPLVGGVFTDSRAVTRGSVFVALRGDTHDGHAFLDTVCAAGPSYVVTERGRPPVDAAVGVLEVEDTLLALGAIARVHLEKWRRGPGKKAVIAITGSAGKTTTKELTAALCGAVAKTHFTAGNLNNRVGVPMMVLSIDPADAITVLEMGMSVPGEIAAVAAIARPDVAIVTNVGVAHAEGVGGREGVMREKGAVYRALDEGGVAIVNADDDFAMRSFEGSRASKKLRFGRAESADYRILSREPNDEGSLVTLATPSREVTISIPLPGEAAAIDLAAALAAQEAATGIVLRPVQISQGLARVRLQGRATIVKLGGDDVLLLDDTYNANPASMRAALATLAEIAGATRRKVAILGEMKELGAHAEAEHTALGDAIADAGVALAIGCGGLVDRALDRAAARGVEVVREASTTDAAITATVRVKAGDAVLVKGSRSVGAERVTAALSEAWPISPKPASSSGT